MLYMWSLRSFDVLIPKLRGEGYLACPIGHNPRPGLCDLEERLGCDAIGIDGYVCCDTGFMDDARQEAFQKKALPALAKFFNCTGWREIGRTEFFEIVMKDTKP